VVKHGLRLCQCRRWRPKAQYVRYPFVTSRRPGYPALEESIQGPIRSSILRLWMFLGTKLSIDRST